MSYENFAYYYDSLMDEQFYEDYYQFILQHCQFDEVFELGCGTGEMAIRLAKSNKTVYASDISSDMLEVAKQKAIEQQVNLVLQRVDMCDFTLSRPVDLVLCLCDSLNYLTDPQQMTQTFLNVFQSLGDGGTFIFDVDSLYKMDVILKDYHEKEEDEEFILIGQLKIFQRVIFIIMSILKIKKNMILWTKIIIKRLILYHNIFIGFMKPVFKTLNIIVILQHIMMIVKELFLYVERRKFHDWDYWCYGRRS